MDAPLVGPPSGCIHFRYDPILGLLRVWQDVYGDMYSSGGVPVRMGAPSGRARIGVYTPKARPLQEMLHALQDGL